MPKTFLYPSFRDILLHVSYICLVISEHKPLRNVVSFVGEPHQATLDLDPHIKGQEEVQSTGFAVSWDHVTEG